MDASLRTSFFPILGLMLAVAGLSLFFMNQSLRLDEAQSLWQTSRDLPGIFYTIAQDVHVPLYHTVLHFWRATVGDSVESARILSLLFYVATIPIIYALGRMSYSHRVGLFAALLFAVSPFMNWYGSEVRMYALFVFLATLNQYFFVRIFSGRQSDHVWVGYTTTALLGMFTHYFFFLNLLGQMIFYIIRSDLFPPKALRRFIVAALVIVAAFLPWAWYVYSIGTIGNQDPALMAPTTINLFTTFSQFLFGFQNDHLNTLFLSLWPVTIIFAFLTLRRGVRTSPTSEYLLVSVLVAIVLTFIVSILAHPLFVSRYLIFTIPALYLLLASLFEQLPHALGRAARFATAAIMLLMLAIEIVSPTTPVKEDYRGAAEYLTEHAGAQDVVLVSAPFTVYPVEYYYRGTAPLQTIPLWNRYEFGPIPAFSEERLPQEVATLTDSHQQVWLLLSYDQGYKETVRLYFDNNFEKVLEKNFSPGLDLYVYKLRYDTPLSTQANDGVE
jgi:mannosyltransferase